MSNFTRVPSGWVIPAVRLVLALCLVGGTALCWAQSMTLASDWKTIDDKTGKPKALIRIVEQTDGSYSGTVIRGLVPSADPNRVCTACRGALKDQKIIGMTILTGLRKDGAGSYSGGEIVDPDNGKTYHCKAWLIEGGGRLKVRGYIGIPLLGRTQTWVREKEAP